MISNLKNIVKVENPNGDIYKLLNKNDDEFNGFGECYITYINKEKVKAWKMHRRMTCILIPISGVTKCVIYNQKDKSFKEYFLDASEPKRLIITPNKIFGFCGHKTKSSILNIADIKHDPNESIKFDIKEFEYSW